MTTIEVRYTVEGSPHCAEFDTMEEAEAFVTALIEAYGDAYVQNLTIERLE